MPRKRPRGYMLVETLIAGGMLSVAIMAVFHSLSTMDRQLSESIRSTQAQSALIDGVNRCRGRAWANLAGCTGVDTPPGTVSRTITMGAALANATCQNCRQLTVTVRYRTNIGITRALTQTTFMTP